MGPLAESSALAAAVAATIVAAGLAACRTVLVAALPLPLSAELPGLAAAQVAARPTPRTAVAKIRGSRARLLPDMVMRAPEVTGRWHS
jgi:hypothetical protein